MEDNSFSRIFPLGVIGGPVRTGFVRGFGRIILQTSFTLTRCTRGFGIQGKGRLNSVSCCSLTLRTTP